MMLFSHGTDSIGLAEIDRWRVLLSHARDEGVLIGVDEERFPRDFATFARFDSALRERAPLLPPPPALSAEGDDGYSALWCKTWGHPDGADVAVAPSVVIIRRR